MNWTPNTNGYYFKRYLTNNKIFNDNKSDKEKFINENTELLSKCINPNEINFHNNNLSTGIAIGYIQSGKTSSMEAIANLARDNGFKIIIILSGTVGNLTTQTQERLFRTMRGIGWKRIYIPEAKRSFNKNKTAEEIKNALSTWDNVHFNEDEKRTTAIVSMKSTYRINKIFDVFSLLEDKYNIDLSSIPTLIIDDECDHYSLNSRYNEENINNEIENENSRRIYTGPEFYEIKDEDLSNNGSVKEDICELFNINIEELERLNPSGNFSIGNTIQISGNESATHRRIKNLRSIFKYHTYLGYTATPYASLLISTFNTLSPKFGKLLTPGTNYTGSDYFFNNGRRQSNVEIFDEQEIQKLSADGLIPDSLKRAIHTFLIGVAIGIHEINKDHLKMKSRSMIVHSTAQTGAAAIRNENIPLYLCHEHFVTIISEYIDELKELFAERKSEKYFESINLFRICHDDIYEKAKNKELIFKFDDRFLNLIEKSLYFTDVIEFNARENDSIPNIEWGEEGYARILVGGHGIERGYTVEGLTISYMSRNPSESIDTSMQRARFFGYHKEYIDLVRIFLTVSNNELYQDCFTTELNMRNSLEDHINSGKDIITWPRFFLSDRNQNYLPTRRSILGFDLHRNKRDIQIALDSMVHDLEEEILNSNRRTYDIILKDENIKPIASLYGKNSKREWIKRREDLIIENTTLVTVLNILNKIEHHDNNLMQFYSIKTLIEQFLDSNEDILCPIILMKTKSSNELMPFRTMLPNGSINLHGGGLKEIDRINGPHRYPGDNFMHYEFITNEKQNGSNLHQFPSNIPTLQVYNIDVILNDNFQDEPIALKFKNINENKNSINFMKAYRENIPCFNFFTPEKIWKNIIYGTARS